MPNVTMTNCHIHTFNLNHVPESFVPKLLMAWVKTPYLRTPLIFALTRLNPFRKNDIGNRYARFAKIASMGEQAQTFATVQGYYPDGTRFVVLPMDMAFMGAGKPKVDLPAQHDELARLAQETGGLAIPFAAVDPRRKGVLDELKRAVEVHGFKGVKLYPPLGYMPSHNFLMDEVYPYCVDNALPVLSHCSRGGVKSRLIRAEKATSFASPAAFVPVLDAFPELKVCLAHFGGEEDWRAYLSTPFPSDPERREAFRKENWLAHILDLLREETAPGVKRYPNLWTDISYTVFNIDENIPALKVFLEDGRVATRVLFGSDFYMTEQEKFPERRLSMRLRSEIGETTFRQITETNPAVFLDTGAGV